MSNAHAGTSRLTAGQQIDRRHLVGRHDVRRTAPDPLEPLSVGNGEFAFTADVTGLQTLTDLHAGGMPLHTQAQWAWHTAPNPHGYALADAYANCPLPDGRQVPYLTTGDSAADTRHERAATWLRENPHRIDLGRIGFVAGDRPIDPSRLTRIDQRLDLWRGRIDSAFEIDAVPVRVRTSCHPTLDVLGIRVESDRLRDGHLGIGVRFPYAIGDWVEPCDWDADDAHHSELTTHDRQARVRRVLDGDTHEVGLAWSAGVRLEQSGRHELHLRADDTGVLELVIGFAPDSLGTPLPSLADIEDAATRHWEEFWTTGGAIDLDGSSDPRAPELERRIVLSQYLTAVHCAGSTPPAETGLVTNSWRGKFHLEMHWWHAAHFPLWGRPGLLTRSLHWYQQILPAAREYARLQGYAGARWPKQIGPEGRESPSDVGAFLIWQQPHPIFYAELIRRSAKFGDVEPEHQILHRYAALVFETAAFMASYPVRNAVTGSYDLGPPLTSAQEKAFHDRSVSRNPTFELAYWSWALHTAVRWRRRLGLSPMPAWEEVAHRLAPLPVRNGRYVELEHPVTGDEGHPTMVGALGFVPETGRVDRDVMRRTLQHVLTSWEWGDTWGWDYPLLAMTACRSGEPEAAVDALLLDSPKNGYLGNGHNFQQVSKLPLYLPGNGGLLYATAMMATGWDGSPAGAARAPGFPSTGWNVRTEGLRPAP